LQSDRWFIGYRRYAETGSAVPPTEGFSFLEPPKAVLSILTSITRDGRDFIFFEDYSYHDGKGVISCVEIDAQGRPGRAPSRIGTALSSVYPFVFEWNGDV